MEIDNNMSDLCNQAIINAKALREQAQKTVLTEFISKYSPTIKERVDSLLMEQGPTMPMPGAEDESIMGDPEIPGGPVGPDAGAELADEMGLGDEGAPLDDFVAQIPLAVTDDDTVGGEPSDDDEIEIDFDALMGSDDDTVDGVEPIDVLDMVDDVPADDEPLFEEFDDLSDEELMELADDLSEAIIDMYPVKSGWLGRNRQLDVINKKKLDASENNHTGKDPDEVELTTGQDAPEPTKMPMTSSEEKVTKKKADEVDKIEKITEVAMRMVRALKESQDEVARLKKDRGELAQMLERQLLESARLTYELETRKDSSLNEQQRTVVVEAIQRCSTVEKVREVYETSMKIAKRTASPRRRGSNFLSEVRDVARQKDGFRAIKPVPKPKTKTGAEREHDQQVKRWQVLANIKKEEL